MTQGPKGYPKPSDRVIEIINEKDMEPLSDKLDDEIIKLVRVSCSHAGLDYKTEVKLMSFFIEHIDDRFIDVISDYIGELQEEVKQELKVYDDYRP